MGRLNVTGLNALSGFFDGAEKFTRDIDKISQDSINKASRELEKTLKNNIKAVTKGGSGDLARSIAATKAKKNDLGNYSVTRAVGVDSNGVRNVEKLAYLEYGTSRGQPARPVLQKSLNDAEKKVTEIIQKEIEGQASKYMEE